jgi:phosphatidylglycerophosphate synthase
MSLSRDTHTTNESILLPFYEKFIYRHVIKIIPLWLPANLITCLSTILMIMGYVLAAMYGRSEKSLFIILPVFIFLYIFLDDLDGIHARRTNATSPLGEYLDHAFDIINLGMVFGILLQMLDVSSLWLNLFYIMSLYVIINTTFYKQYVTGILSLERFGIPETLTLIAVIIILSGFDGIYAAFSKKILMETSFIQIFVFLCSMSYAFYAIGHLLSIGLKKIKIQMYIYLLLNIPIGIACLRFDSRIIILLTILLYNSNYATKILRARILKEGKDIWPFFMIPLYCLLYLFMENFLLKKYIFIVLIFQGIINIYNFGQIFEKLSSHWRWINRT